MSENLQHNQRKYFAQNFQHMENAYCLNCLLTGQYNSCDECKNGSMLWSSIDNSTYYDANAKIQSDLNVVRDCLGHRQQTEEQAINSLFEVEAMVEIILNEYSRLYDANHYLNEELINCNELVLTNFDVIATLRNEYEVLMEENVKLKKENQKLNGKNVSTNDVQSDENSNELHDNFRTEIEELQQQLVEKNELIMQLLTQVDRFTVSRTGNSMNESIQNEIRSDEHIQTSSIDNKSNVLNNEIEIEKITMDIEKFFNEKQRQLLERQIKIDQLAKELESQKKPSNAKNDEESESKFNFKLKELEEHKNILSQQLTIYEEQIAVLMDDQGKLAKSNNDLIKSISICQGELCKFNEVRLDSMKGNW